MLNYSVHEAAVRGGKRQVMSRSPPTWHAWSGETAYLSTVAYVVNVRICRWWSVTARGHAEAAEWVLLVLDPESGVATTPGEASAEGLTLLRYLRPIPPGDHGLA